MVFNKLVTKLLKREAEEKELTFVSEKPDALEMKVDFIGLKVFITTDKGKLVGEAQVMPTAMDHGERVCTLSIFKSSMQKHGVGRMMLSGVIAIAKADAATKIEVLPVPLDLQIAEIPILTKDELYSIYEKLGFKFYDSKVERSATIKKMYLKI